MLLDDSRGCTGYKRITGPLAGICFNCTRLDKPNPITPAARCTSGEWHCSERRHSITAATQPHGARTPAPVASSGAPASEPELEPPTLVQVNP